ncbi:MAG: serine/threonine-protein kinase [Gemmatimonadota bacterium]
MSGASDEWRELQAMFEAALERPVGVRACWLSTSIRDPLLRERVAALLAGHQEDGGFDRLSGALAGLGGPPSTGTMPDRVGPYTPEKLLGEGGVSLVFAARRSAVPHAPLVAVKLIRPEVDGEGVRRRFFAECEIVARLAHPGIARFVDAGLTREGVPYLVTEYVEGVPIDQYADGLEPTDRLELLFQLCDAVEVAHLQGVVHRDLKPANILVERSGRVRLLDFGIAKVVGGVPFAHLARETSAGVRVMTLRYASPEQWAGEEITPASDVYQLGLLFHRVLAGRLPIPVDFAIEDGLAVALSAEADGGTPKTLDPVVARALAVQPQARYASAGLLGRAARAGAEKRTRPEWWSWLRR